MQSLRGIREANPNGFQRYEIFQELSADYSAWHKECLQRKIEDNTIERDIEIVTIRLIDVMAQLSTLVIRPLFTHYIGQLSGLHDRLRQIKADLKPGTFYKAVDDSKKIFKDFNRLKHAIQSTPPKDEERLSNLDRQFLAPFSALNFQGTNNSSTQPEAANDTANKSKETPKSAATDSQYQSLQEFAKAVLLRSGTLKEEDSAKEVQSQGAPVKYKDIIKLLTEVVPDNHDNRLRYDAIYFANYSISLSLGLVQLIGDEKIRELTLDELRKIRYPCTVRAFDGLKDALHDKFEAVHDAVMKFPKAVDRQKAFNWLNDSLNKPVPKDFPKDFVLPDLLDSDILRKLKTVLGTTCTERNDIETDLAINGIALGFVESGNYNDFLEILPTISDPSIKEQTGLGLVQHFTVKGLEKRQYNCLFIVVKEGHPEVRPILVEQIVLSLADDFPQFAKDLLRLFPTPNADKILKSLDELEKMSTFESIQKRFKAMLHTWHALNFSIRNFEGEDLEECQAALEYIREGDVFKEET